MQTCLILVQFHAREWYVGLQHVSINYPKQALTFNLPVVVETVALFPLKISIKGELRLVLFFRDESHDWGFRSCMKDACYDSIQSDAAPPLVMLYNYRC